MKYDFKPNLIPLSFIISILFGISLFIMGCPLPLRYIKFDKDGKSVKKYKSELSNNRITMELEGYYWWIGPELELHLKVSVSHKNEEDSLIFKAENIFMTFNNKSLDWRTPELDSLDMIVSSQKYSISKCFGRQSLTEADVDYLRNTEFPLIIAFNDFIIINDTAIVIDTIHATSPELKYYDNW